MSAETECSYQPFPDGNGPANWRACRRGPGWKPVEIAAMVLGFIVFWPIGLAVLGWKIWQKNSGYQGDITTFVRDKWDNGANWSSVFDAHGAVRRSRWWDGTAMGSTGNSAFDDWRASELARLEEERIKLVQAEREFANYIDSLRRAKDREEFDRFMAQRQSGQGNGPGPAAL